MWADTTFATDLPTYGHVLTKTAEQRRNKFEHSGSSSAPNWVLIATPIPQIGSLGLVGEKTSAHVVFLPVKFCDLAVSAQIDSGATHKFPAASLLLKLLV